MSDCRNRGSRKPLAALDPRLGNAHAGQERHRQPEELQAGVLEVDAPLHLVLGHARGAQRPGGSGVLGADGAGAGDGLVERRIAPAAAPDLGGGELHLAVEEEPRAGDQPLGQVGSQRRRVRDQDAAGRVGQHELALGADLVPGLVVDDPVGAQHPAVIEHLDVARGGELPCLAIVGHLVGNQADGEILPARDARGKGESGQECHPAEPGAPSLHAPGACHGGQPSSR